MKYLAIIGFTSSLCWAAPNFTTGQAARLVIGQPTFTAQSEDASATVLGGVGGLAYANNTLIVTDSNRVGATPLNHRVLIYKNLSSQLPAPTAEFPVDAVRCHVCVGEANVVLGQPDFTTTELETPSEITLRSPLAVATDGSRLIVADTDNNRVLIWNSIPTSNQEPADVVLGQPNFQRAIANDGGGFTPNERSFKGPQGVWIQGGRLYIADTGNNRIMIYNQIPSTNHAPASLVLGAPDFRTFVQPDITQEVINAQANTLLAPVSVTSDGQRLFVSDLGHNRVLIWNTLPTSNGQAADVVLGQPNMTSAVPNNVEVMCASNGVDEDGEPTYPNLCDSTMEYPRYALSDGHYLFIADGGNDRVMIYDGIPTSNGQPADVILGQISPVVNLISDNADPRGVASAAAVRTPQSLAWDGFNLFVSDPFNRRVMVFSLGERLVPNTGVRNAASREIYAVGSIAFDGEPEEGDEITITINERDYTYELVEGETFQTLVQALANLINAGTGDPEVLATPNPIFGVVVLTARVGGSAGDEIDISVSAEGPDEDEPQVLLPRTSGATLRGGNDAAQIAPGTIVAVFGENLSQTTVSAPEGITELPRELGGVQVYIDGIRVPLLMVSPNEIRAQIPWEVSDAESTNAVVRQVRNDGSILVSTPVAVPIIPQNPGIFAEEGAADPRPAFAYHSSSHATGTISVDGTATAGNTARVTIEDRVYSYTAQAEDTLITIRDRLIALINQDPKVEAFPSAFYSRIRLRARVAGPLGNGITYGVRADDANSVLLTPTTIELCCANEYYSRITEDNPALPGETIIVLATGEGFVTPDAARDRLITGRIYDGPALNDPDEFVSSLAGGRTANVLAAGMKPGTFAIYEVHLELNSDLPTNPQTQLTIAQDVYVSNIVTIPVFNPRPADGLQ